MEKEQLVKWSNFFLNPTRDINKEDVTQLQEVIRENNRLYYNEESPVISDKEYDILFKTLKNLEESFNIYDSNSPTKRIDVLASNQFEKGFHMSPMISLDNTYDEEDLKDFEKRIRNIIKDDSKKLEYFIEFKYDWLGMSLTYENWKLVRALTRWNWIEWEDITVNAMQFQDKFVPKAIPYKGKIEVRWEVIMTKFEFERLNKKRLETWEKLFANPRNAASWSLRQIDYNITRSRNLSFYAYSCPYLESEENRKEFAIAVNREEVKTYKDYENTLYDLWFQTQRMAFATDIKDMDSIFSYIELLWNLRDELDFEIDGLVIKLNDISLWNTLWTTEHHPRYAIAYKFPATNVRTTVLDIEHSVWRTWIITPIAHLDPVNVSWVVVSKATLHNYDELAKKDVRIGDNVFIVRAWEVIPEVVSVITEARNGEEIQVWPPEACPSCSTKLVKDDWKVAWYCPNKKLCPAQTLGSLISFVSKYWANIEGLWDKIIELFVEKWIITDFVSIYRLPDFKDEILTFEWFKEKRIQNILDEVEASRSMNLANFLVALWIPQVGRKTAKVLEKYVAWKIEWQGILEVLISLTIEELELIKDIWPIWAHSIVYYFEENLGLVSGLLEYISPKLPQIQVSSESVENEILWKSFCVTGGFEWITRDEIHELIENNAWEVRTSVSSKLDFLIVWSDAWSKLTKAKELWVGILDLDWFYKMLGR